MKPPLMELLLRACSQDWMCEVKVSWNGNYGRSIKAESTVAPHKADWKPGSYLLKGAEARNKVMRRLRSACLCLLRP